MIIVPNKSTLDMKDPFHGVTGVQGFYKIEAVKADAHGQPIEKSRRLLADWFPNLILNAGLDRIGNNVDWMTACQVGTGTTPPAFTDTQLVNRLAGTSSTSTTVNGANTAPPYYGWRRTTFRFNAGTATGNLSEVGIGWSTTGANLFSRALITDSNGNPTTITVLADEFLDVTYELRNYPPTSDATNVVTISGTAYTFTTRACDVLSQAAWAVGSGGARGGIWTGTSSSLVAYSGTIQAVTASSPSGSANAPSSGFPTLAAYTNGTYFRDGTAIFSLSDGNISGGIPSFLCMFGTGSGSSRGGLGTFQYAVSPAIPKTNIQTLSMTFRHSWARRAL